MLDEDEAEHDIWAVGLDSITDEIEHCNLEPLYSQFPEVNRALLKRPTGSVDILIGMDYRGFHPVAHITRDHLRVTKSKFGSGFILTGTGNSGCPSQSRKYVGCNFAQATRDPPQETHIHHIGHKLTSFWEAEDMGCQPLPTCKSCRSCPDCRYRAEYLTAEQRATVDEMAASIQLTNGKPPIRLSYPLHEIAHAQQSNHIQALAVQKSHEKRVLKENILDDYNNEMQKALDAGSVVKLTKEEMNEWKGGIHYIAHFQIM